VEGENSFSWIVRSRADVFGFLAFGVFSLLFLFPNPLPPPFGDFVVSSCPPLCLFPFTLCSFTVCIHFFFPLVPFYFCLVFRRYVIALLRELLGLPPFFLCTCYPVSRSKIIYALIFPPGCVPFLGCLCISPRPPVSWLCFLLSLVFPLCGGPPSLVHFPLLCVPLTFFSFCCGFVA